jgi:antitoxin component of MazEF toxin-antitoxin module
MLLGTYHFANPGRDDVKLQVDDVLAPTRQREIAELVQRLAAWHPEQVAVEWSASDSASIAAQYARYRSGSLEPSRNEVVQIGFRLAARLGLPSVEPIDVSVRIGNDSVGVLEARRPDLKELTERALARLQHESDSGAATFAAKSIVAQLHALNGEAALHAGNSRGMFGALLPLGEGTNYGGPQVLARWYERNILMVHLLYRSLRPSTRRALVIVGAGHVPPMRNLLDEAPQFCPVSPLPLL